MKHIAAYLLAQLVNPTPSKEDISKILSSVGSEANSTLVDKLFSEVEGKDINELIQGGLSKLSSVPSGGSAVAAAPAAGASSAAAAAPAAEEKKEEKEESDEDMGFGLFD